MKLKNEKSINLCPLKPLHLWSSVIAAIGNSGCKVPKLPKQLDKLYQTVDELSRDSCGDVVFALAPSSNLYISVTGEGLWWVFTDTANNMTEAGLVG